MAEEQECVAVSRGEIVPLLFEVYTDSGVPFEVREAWAVCTVKKTSGEQVDKITAKLIADELSKKKFLASWDTGGLDLGYYLLQVWVKINITGEKDPETGEPTVEAYIASDELKRYVK